MKISELVEKYKADRDSHLNSAYNETQLRNDFIDPFLKCLGWDVDNQKGKPHLFRDVIQEEYIEVAGENKKKKPDYTLRVNGTRKIFVEVKKPSVDILKSAKAAFQTRRYGWSANLGISVLMNFEHIVIYDCRVKPELSEDEHIARYKVFSYEKYDEAIDEISELISYDAISSGNMNEMFNVNSRVGETFDENFLQQIETWRERLAKTAIKDNIDLNEEDVNYVIQRLLNRIIFLRICEDRTIEKYETIKGIKNYNELKRLFLKSDHKFNSGLFDFIDDTLSLEVNIEADVLIGIFSELYYPLSPYDFSVVDSAILSQIYERFLGKKITIEPDGNFHIKEAPEVSASSGVVPTPKIIVEQIVKETLTPLVRGKTYKELCHLNIADICCGSGTFLISTYDFLLEKMLEKIDDEKIDDSDLVFRTDKGEVNFTLKAKRNIIENNLFGVDINPYAVEVAIFSLLLKLLENEDEISINYYTQQYTDKILPNLKSNIKCGNSLVDNKFFDFMPEALDNNDILFSVKPFDWHKEFPLIMNNGGFDAIVGNPPYVRIQNMKKYSPEELKYYQTSNSQYIVAKKATIDKYFIFIQRAVELLNPTGLLGYIVPHKFFLTLGGKELRKFITEYYQISKIIHFGTTQVFPEKSTYTAILILQANKKEQFEFKKVDNISTESLSIQEDIHCYKTERYNSAPWIFLSPETEAIFEKFESEKYEQLGNITDIAVGLQTSADDIYIFVPKEETEDIFTFTHRGEDYEIEKSICRSTIYDLSFDAFESIKGNAQMIFPYRINNEKAELLSEEELEENYPLTWKYLNKNRTQLEKRSMQGTETKWYQFGRSQSLVKFHNADKLIWSVLATKPPYVLDTENLLFTGGGNGPYYGLLNKSDYSLLYFLGILSHPVIEGMVKARASEFRGSYYSHGKQFIEKLPIRKIDSSNKEQMENYNKVIDKVRDLLLTTVQLKAEKNSSRRKIFERKYDTLFNQLIEVINILYQIDGEEFATVMSDGMLSISTGENE